MVVAATGIDCAFVRRDLADAAHRQKSQYRLAMLLGRLIVLLRSCGDGLQNPLFARLQPIALHAQKETVDKDNNRTLQQREKQIERNAVQPAELLDQPFEKEGQQREGQKDGAKKHENQLQENCESARLGWLEGTRSDPHRHENRQGVGHQAIEQIHGYEPRSLSEETV